MSPAVWDFVEALVENCYWMMSEEEKWTVGHNHVYGFALFASAIMRAQKGPRKSRPRETVEEAPTP